MANHLALRIDGECRTVAAAQGAKIHDGVGTRLRGCPSCERDDEHRQQEDMPESFSGDRAQNQPDAGKDSPAHIKIPGDERRWKGSQGRDGRECP